MVVGGAFSALRSGVPFADLGEIGAKYVDYKDGCISLDRTGERSADNG